MEYGHFSEDGYEYIISEPLTPRPWINYLTNNDYCAVISSTAGGYSFYKDSRTERLLAWHGKNLFSGRPGRYVYIRDTETEEVWSPTWEPVRKKLNQFECRVGIGYQVIESKFKNIATEITYFVPRKESCELIIVKIKNESNKEKKLNIFGYVEWLIGNADNYNFHNIAILWNRVNFDKSLGSIIARKTASYEEYNIKNNPYVAFFSSSEKISGWDCNKEKFLGIRNTEASPKGVFEGKCGQTICDGEEAIGVLQHNLTLKAKEEKEFVLILGQTKGKSDASKIIKKYKNLKNTKKELEAVKSIWRERVDKIQVETPDPEFDKMMNIWIKYQLYICNMWSRSPSFYHEGQGGRGYRDSCQDAEGIMSLDINHAKEKMRRISKIIRCDGTCAPGWSDTYGSYSNRPFKDHPTWFVSTVSAYVKETGDIEFLNEKTNFIKDKWRNRGTKADVNWNQGAVCDIDATIFDAILAQLNCSFSDVSVHGIPRVGEADWNDALDMAGRRQIGESVWIGIALVRSLKLAAELAALLGKHDVGQDLLSKAETMKKAVNDSGWDGAWYLAGYNDDLVPFGSNKNKEGKIFLNSQSWAILADVVTPERLPIILKSVDKYLDGKHGLALLEPAYTVFDPGLGRIAMFSQGTKENAAVFCHAHTFMLAAYCKLGMGNRNYEQMCKIMPNKQKDMNLYKAEPYTYAEYLIGPDHPYAYGEGAFTWLTGTAGWTFMVATEWVLGARREFEGLCVDPCIPSKWKSCRIVRPFRGATYDILIENPNKVEHGVKEVFVDDIKIEGNLIKPHHDGKTHQVRVVMG